MKEHGGCARFWLGSGALLATLVILFTLFNATVPTLGATKAEIARSMPGDNIIPSPVAEWNNAITIKVPVEQVWPWLIQMGDSRAAYYSYTFIENMIAGSDMYNNADRIHSDWQNPPAGQGMISDYLVLKEYQPNRYMLATATDKMPPGTQWSWLWYVEPAGAGLTRLHVRLRIAPPEGAPPALTRVGLNLATFMMEKRMMDGIRIRATGGTEPAWIEVAEIAIWLSALLAGVVCAVWFLRTGRNAALVLGLSAVVLLFLFTYQQPSVILRAVMALALWGGLVVFSDPYERMLGLQKAPTA